MAARSTSNGNSNDGSSATDTHSPKYRAPALEKGLDIIELLARTDTPLSPSQITQRLDRSLSELFRMIQVLEHRGYIEQAPTGDGYRVSNMLFTLAMERTPVKTLLELALPEMSALANATGQSCHIAMRSGGQMVVVARIESPTQIGFSVRIGYRRSLVTTASGTVLFAYQDKAEQERWISSLDSDISSTVIATWRAHAAQIRQRGYERVKSGFTAGVTDLSAPILRGDIAAAALTIPYLHSTVVDLSVKDAIKQLRETAATISNGLVASDHRV